MCDKGSGRCPGLCREGVMGPNCHQGTFWYLVVGMVRGVVGWLFFGVVESESWLGGWLFFGGIG